MVQEGKRQLDGVSHPAQTIPEGIIGLFDLIGAEVGEFAPFDVIPDSFGGIEIRRVGGQPLDLDPVLLLGQELFHRFAAVCRKTIPDQDDFVSFHEALEVFEKSDQALSVEAVRLGSGQQARLLAVPSKSERCRHRGPGPMVPAGFQDRCFPTRSPGPADRGLLGETGFVLKEDPGTLASSVFFSSGQRTVFQ